MPDITITDFTDFVLRTGPPKIAKVVEIFNRGEYVPAHDFWKLLRDHICEFHEGASSQLAFGLTGAHEKKKFRYDEAIKGYKKFLKSDEPEWFKPHHAEWRFEDLAVRINPEVGFLLGGESVLVKLYFKQERLTKYRVQVVLALMIAGQKSKKHCVGVLDVVRSKLFIGTTQNAQMEALLRGEAATFLGIWNSLTQQG
ncbi:MAG: hypothetical protein ABSG10_04575 [Terracidiphilus sp.]|jgi:hypothetical protein